MLMYNGYPYQQYGTYIYPAVPGPEQQEYYRRVNQVAAEKKELKLFSKVAGACVLGYIIVQNAIGIFLAFIPDVRYAYLTNPDFQSACGIIYSILGVLLPFALGACYLRNKQSKEIIHLDAPNDKALMLLLVPVGFMFCLAANFATNYLTEFIESVGFKLKDIDYNVPTTIAGRIFYILEIAVVPPLCEEFAVRGVVMQPLRKYGDWFAIIISSIVFAVMHGNLIQAPFAFIAGIFLGFVACKTNSLLTGMLIHFLNNAFSIFLEFLLEDVSSTTVQNVVYYAVIGAFFFIGAICCLILAYKYGKKILLDNKKPNVIGEKKWSTYIFTLPMILALLSMLYVTAQFVSWTGGK